MSRETHSLKRVNSTRVAERLRPLHPYVFHQIYGDGGETLIPPPPHTFQLVQNMHSHPDRKRTILEAHPDIEDLYGYDWRTKWLTLSLAVGNLSLAAYVSMNWRELPWWGMFLIVYCLGAPMNHAWSMIIHDCCHDLQYHII